MLILFHSRRLVVVFCIRMALLNCAAGHWIFFAIDVDFVPSANLYASLAANSEWLTSVAPSGLLSQWFAYSRACSCFVRSQKLLTVLYTGVVVVPSFEADQNQNPPATKAELDECISEKRCRGVLEVPLLNVFFFAGVFHHV